MQSEYHNLPHATVETGMPSAPGVESLRFKSQKSSKVLVFLCGFAFFAIFAIGGLFQQVTHLRSQLLNLSSDFESYKYKHRHHQGPPPSPSPRPESGPLLYYEARLFSGGIFDTGLDVNSGWSNLVNQNYTLYNRNSDIDWDSYITKQLASGIQGGEHALWLDLGTREDLIQKYGIPDDIPRGEVFASIHWDNATSRLQIAGKNYALINQEWQPMDVMGNCVGSLQGLTPKPLHMFLLKICDSHTAKYRIIKGHIKDVQDNSVAMTIATIRSYRA